MSEPFLAEIVMFAGNFAPRGWAFCNGQIMSIAQNTALFSLLGTTYGGNGQTTYALPDFRGRSPVGTGQGPGFSDVVLGEVSGTENVTLLTTQMPAHTHTATVGDLTLKAKNTPGNSASPSGNALAAEAAGVTATYVSGATPDVAMATGSVTGAPTIGIAGNSQPTPIRNPFLGMNFIICLEGVFPSRN